MFKGICLGITLGAFTLFIAEGCAFSALDAAAYVMFAFIALGLGANVMLTCTLFPSTCLTDSNPSIHLTVTEGVSTSIAWVADTELQGLITVVTELVWINFLRGCKANAIGAAASRAADATVDLVALGAVKRFDILVVHNVLVQNAIMKEYAAFQSVVSSVYVLWRWISIFFRK